ncbi:MAG: ABC transporter permease [Chloroflexota bacterium]|nr:ABC transporter permease [Chloroflexota bacterium]
MFGLTKSIVRITSFTGKELREVFRRPGVLASLILGPFGIMLIFGLGYTGSRQPFDTEIVIPAGVALPRDPASYQQLGQGRIRVVRVADDATGAHDRLATKLIDLVVEVPANAIEELRAGHQTTIKIAWNEVDPVYDQLAQLAVTTLVSALNSEIIRQVAAEGINVAGGKAPVKLSPEVIAAPTTAQATNVAPSSPAVINFFGPAVFGLVLQHLAVTLTALSMVRERLSGQMDLFRVSPVTSLEVLLGKYIAFAVLSLAVSGLVAATLVYVLGVPMLAGWLIFLGIVLLLTFAALGVGLLISLVSDSERQAVQLSMLVLLASVFFSGFVLPVEDFIGPVQYLSYLLPVTHGIETLQQAMLRGSVSSTWMLAALAGIGLLLFLASLLRLRRVLRRAD